MGVPAFYRWLCNKFPKAVKDANVHYPTVIEGIKVPVNNEEKNPNGFEFDCLYLDMNGIIHPACHPENAEAPPTEEDMYLAIFEYIDLVFSIVRPRKLLYMAIDGVAPRAKMNQQRSRRFRSSKDSEDKVKEIERLRSEWESLGKKIPRVEKKEHWDQNVITPGTNFMFKLSQFLHFYIAERMNGDPAWQKIKVILSDANVPGEGEHKVMDFIRKERMSEGYNPNTVHAIHGKDADLIMLTLATHEPHFYVLRESDNMPKNNTNTCFLCGQPGHIASECLAGPREKDPSAKFEIPFQMVDIHILREYLNLELDTHLPFAFNLERAIDDFVLLCFFVGNDFLPHLPSLDIREGAIDALIQLYKSLLPTMGGYLACGPDVDLSKLEILLREISKIESEIFRRRRTDEIREEERRQRRKQQNSDRAAQQKLRESGADRDDLRPVGRLLGAAPDAGLIPTPAVVIQQPPPTIQFSAEENKRKAAELKRALLGDVGTAGDGPSVENSAAKKSRTESSISDANVGVVEAAAEGDAGESQIEILNEIAPDNMEESVLLIDEVPPPDEIIATPVVVADDDDETTKEFKAALDKLMEAAKFVVSTDDVMLHENGWRERYYRIKFGIDINTNLKFRDEIREAYIQGICWVMRYYYAGVASWDWFYPYHYAPFAQDLTDLSSIKLNFKIGKPFKPVWQLMAVLPPRSSHAVPPAFAALMKSSGSPLSDVYPADFKIDMNGKKMAWMGISLLPFICQEKLISTIEPLEETMTEEETARNSLGTDLLFCHLAHPLAQSISDMYDADTGDFAVIKITAPIAPESIRPVNVDESDNLFGSIAPVPGAWIPYKAVPSPDRRRLKDIPQSQNGCVACRFFYPETSFKPELLPGVKLRDPVLDKDELNAEANPGQRPRRQSGAMLQAVMTLLQPRQQGAGGGQYGNGGRAYPPGIGMSGGRNPPGGYHQPQSGVYPPGAYPPQGQRDWRGPQHAYGAAQPPPAYGSPLGGARDLREVLSGGRNDHYPRRDDQNGRRDDQYGRRDDQNGRRDDQYGRRDDQYGRRDDQYGRRDDQNGRRDDQYGTRDSGPGGYRPPTQSYGGYGGAQAAPPQYRPAPYVPPGFRPPAPAPGPFAGSFAALLSSQLQQNPQAQVAPVRPQYSHRIGGYVAPQTQPPPQSDPRFSNIYPPRQ